MKYMHYAGLLLAGMLMWNRILVAQIAGPPSGDNQKASVTQYMGPVSITVTYNSPDVHGPNGEDRAGHIWGELVPFGFSDLSFGYSNASNPSPWRAGANENTTIAFNNDILVEGKKLSAGTYGLHMVPGKDSWVIIFSNTSDAWGSFFYEEKDDALRVEVKPHPNAYTEWLNYTFADRGPDHCTLELQWENLAIPVQFKVENIQEVYYEKIKGQLIGTPVGFDYKGWADGANYLASVNYKLDEALSWAMNAVQGQFYSNENFYTLSTVSNVYKAMGNMQESDNWMQKAIASPSASALDIHMYARGLQAQKRNDEALQIYNLNFSKHPDEVLTCLGLARGYSATGDYKKAIKYAKEALALHPDPQIKKTLEDGIVKLEKGEDFN
ncbi:MAG: DUF2911 domain-containing protein [Chitinophagales bacterium]